MTTETYDTLIIGAGAMGSAAAYHLSKDKQKVLLLEQFEIGHGNGSSAGESRIFRFSYTDPGYSRLAMQCKPLWHALEREADTELLRLIGGLDLGYDEVGLRDLEIVIATLQNIGAQHDVLDAPALMQRFPQWRVPPQAKAVYSPDTGFVWAGKAVQTMLAQATAHGAAVHENEPAQKIIPHGDGVEIITHKATYRANKLIITAGAWVNTLLRDVGLQIPIKIEKEQLHYFAPKTIEKFMPNAFPIFMDYSGDFAYGFPVLGSDGYPSGIKCGFHHDSHYIEATDLDRNPNHDVATRMRNYLQQFLPEAAGELQASICCLYTNTPDEDFVIDHVPGFSHIVVASPCSGHGFKFCIGIGRALADLVQHGTTEMEIGHLGLARLLAMRAREEL
jgi:monomeric sarcosine oxidase